MNSIYLDHSATTPVDPEVFEAMKPYFTANFGNPGSIHSFGLEAKKAIDEVRKSIAQFLGCDAMEIIFTSGGSESDNLAIRGVVSSILSSSSSFCHPRAGNAMTRGSSSENSGSQISGLSRMTDTFKPHVITSAFEHKAVLDTIKALEKAGEIEATYIKPGADGVIKVDDVKNAIRDNTVLVSIMYVNNEIGTIQPIREIGKVIKAENDRRFTLNCHPDRSGGILSDQKDLSTSTHIARDDKIGKELRVFFHTDAVQAAEYLPMNVNDLGVDLLTMTAHKIYGPKGVGLLYARKGTPILPEITGGGQERGMRAGTENTAGIAGLQKAVENIAIVKCQMSNVKKLRDKLIDGILTTIPDSILNGDRAKLAPHIANISFINAEGEAILLNLDFLGIAVSTGSACTSRTLEPSHVLTSMGIPPEKAHGSIRFSLGKGTTEEEIDKVLEVLPPIIKRLREMSPFS